MVASKHVPSNDPTLEIPLAMEAVFAKIEAETNSFNPGDEEIWRELYEPLCPAPPGNISVVKDISYGPFPRNRLDVFFPTKTQESPRAVLLFVHGGGFFSGDKAWSEKCWANIAFFFASQNIITILATHRLVPDVTYPGGADDIQHARDWIYANISDPKYGKGDAEKVILMGHSSGGAHIAMNLYSSGDPKRGGKDEIWPPVAGVVYLSTPFWFDMNKPVRKRVLEEYFGSDNVSVWGKLSPLGLFVRMSDDSPLLDSEKMPTYIGTVKWEVKETADATITFFNAYRTQMKPAGALPLFNVLDKHNHLSNVLSIGTEDTSQSTLLLEFIQSCVAKVDARGRQLDGPKDPDGKVITDNCGAALV